MSFSCSLVWRSSEYKSDACICFRISLDTCACESGGCAIVTDQNRRKRCLTDADRASDSRRLRHDGIHAPHWRQQDADLAVAEAFHHRRHSRPSARQDPPSHIPPLGAEVELTSTDTAPRTADARFKSPERAQDCHSAHAFIHGPYPPTSASPGSQRISCDQVRGI